jgi:hypothetical protein
MGMDVIGVNPTTKRGEYFRNNVWWWRKLADYCLENHGDIAEKCEYWHSNDGDGLNADDSVALAERLLDDIANGRVDEYARSYNEWRASLPREDCNFCNGTGIRTDRVGCQHGMPERELPVEVQILVERTHGYCNGCGGIGTRESFMASYPFSKDNVEEFAHFLAECGGFQIC